HFNKQTVVAGQGRENVRRFDSLPSLFARAFHRPLKQIRSVWRYAKTFANVLLPAGIESLVDGDFDDDWIQRELAHRRVKHVRLFMHQSLKDMFDCDKILITLPGLSQRVLEDSLATVSELVFIRT